MPALMKKILKSAVKPENPHRVVALIGLLSVFSIIPMTAFLTGLLIDTGGTQSRAAEAAVPLIEKKDAVVIGERKVCSFISSNQHNIGVTGEDGGASTNIGSKSFFVFGDVRSSPTYLPNTVATSTDTDASDCVPMTTKSSAGRAQPMLDKLSTECTVWPTDAFGMGGSLYFFYSSWSNTCDFTDAGRIALGLGRMDANTLTSTRLNNFFWRQNDTAIPNFHIHGATFSLSGSDLFVIWQGLDNNGKQIHLLSKVDPAKISTKSAYSHWNGSAFQPNPASMVNLWNQGDITAHGLSVRFNQFLGKWTAIYNTGYSTTMVVRTASNITGPWSEEKLLTKCLEHFRLSDTSPYPCYGGKEHKQFEKNAGQIIYTSHSNFELYEPFFHEVIFGSGISQWQDSGGNAIYREDSESVSGAVKEGVAFYASKNQLPGYSAIKDWVKGSEHIYSANDPGSGFVDSGVAFYAPTSRAYSLAPIYRWDKGTIHRYSALDLSAYGYTRGPLEFWAKITAYKVNDDKVFAQKGSFFTVGVKKDGNWVQGGKLKEAEFSGLGGGQNYSIVTNTYFSPNRFLTQNTAANGDGRLSESGDLGYVSTMGLGVFPGNQGLNTASSEFGYHVRWAANGQSPQEVGHQVNPYRKAPNFKSFFLTGSELSPYDARVCNVDCATGAQVWTGPVQFCEGSLMLSPTGSTVCSTLSKLVLNGFTAATDYQLFYCSPNCEDALITVIYAKRSNSSGEIKLERPVDLPPVLPLNKYRAEYFNNPDFTQSVLVREEDKAALTGGGFVGRVPVPELVADGQFSIRWEGRFDNLPAGKYRFNLSSGADSAKVYVDDQLKAEGAAVTNGLVDISAGEHKIKVEYAKTRADRPYSFLSNYVERTTCFDLNGDAKINSGDQGVLAQHINTNGDSPWDFNRDERVNSADQGLMAARFNQNCPHAPFDPTPVACSINAEAVNRGQSVTVSFSSGIASNLQVSMIGAFLTPVYELGKIDGRFGVFTIPGDAQVGLYRVRVDNGGGNFLYCTPDLAVN